MFTDLIAFINGSIDSCDFDGFISAFNSIISSLDDFLSTPLDSFSSRFDFLEQYNRHFGTLSTLHTLSLITGVSYYRYCTRFYEYRSSYMELLLF